MSDKKKTQKIILLKGLPGSGKSTWAKEYLDKATVPTKRVNKDDLRVMLDNGKWSKSNEQFVLFIRNYIITCALNDGCDVVVDDTNFAPKHEEEMYNIAAKYKNVDVETKFIDTSLGECIERDSKRTGRARVGKAVIMKMWNQYLKPKSIPYNAKLPKAVICDIDGTLALFGDKNPYERDFINDRINDPVVEILGMYTNLGYKIIIVSGRKDIYRDVTERWLKRHEISYDLLYMRKTAPIGTQEPKDIIVKREIYDTYIKDKYNVYFVIDDRPQVIRLWRELGLPVFDVGDGIEF